MLVDIYLLAQNKKYGKDDDDDNDDDNANYDDKEEGEEEADIGSGHDNVVDRDPTRGGLAHNTLSCEKAYNLCRYLSFGSKTK